MERAVQIIFQKYFLKALAEHPKTQCDSESFKGKLGKRSISLDHDHTRLSSARLLKGYPILTNVSNVS